MRLIASAILAVALLATPALAQDFALSIKDHKFTPAELRIPAGKRVSVTVSNEDGTPKNSKVIR